MEVVLRRVVGAGDQHAAEHVDVHAAAGSPGRGEGLLDGEACPAVAGQGLLDIVGTGVAGDTVDRLLGDPVEVTLVEQVDRVGDVRRGVHLRLRVEQVLRVAEVRLEHRRHLDEHAGNGT